MELYEINRSNGMEAIMVFSSMVFIFRFMPLFFLCYFLTPKSFRNAVLFFGSIVFYAVGEPVYIFLMLFSDQFYVLCADGESKNAGQAQAGILRSTAA